MATSWLCLLACGLSPLLAAPRVPAPPLAAPVRVKVMRGTTIEIPLRVFGDPGQSVTFEIRRAPEHGKALEVRSTGRASAVVLYQQSDDGTHAADRFTFVAKSTGGVSAPVEATIRIADDDTVFVTPEGIDFGKVTAGQAASQVLTLANRGGGVVEGRLICPAPWKIEGGDAAYRLPEAGEKRFTLIFTANEEREYRATVRYSSDAGRETELRARVEAPFALSASTVELSFDPAAQKRGGVIEVTNRGDEALTVQIEKSERLVAPEKIEVAAGGREAIQISTVAGDVAAVDEKILLIAGKHLAELPVRARKVGAVLRAAKPEVPLVEIWAGLGASDAIKIENAGGVRAFVRVDIQPPVQVWPEDAAFTLEPGKVRAVRLSVPAETKSGNFRTALVAKSEDDELRVPVEVRVSESSPTPASSRSHFVRTADNAAQASQPITAGVAVSPDAPDEASASVRPGFPTVRARDLTTTTAELVWRMLPDAQLRYQVETRHIALTAQKELAVSWAPMPAATITKGEREAVASLRNLTPGSLYTLRIAALDPDGNFVAQSAPVIFRSLPRPRVITPLRVLVVTLGILVFLTVRARRRGSLERDGLP